MLPVAARKRDGVVLRRSLWSRIAGACNRCVGQCALSGANRQRVFSILASCIADRGGVAYTRCALTFAVFCVDFQNPFHYFIGWDSHEIIAHEVCKYSCEQQASVAVHFHALKQHVLRAAGVYTKAVDPAQNTEFTYGIVCFAREVTCALRALCAIIRGARCCLSLATSYSCR